MTQETAKSKIKNFKNQITEKFNVGEANGFRTYIGKLSPANVLDMLDDIERSITTDKLSVEKLEPIGYYNGAHGFLHDEFDKDCYCQGGCSMEAVYTESQVKKLTGENKAEKLQEQLNSTVKALTEISNHYLTDESYDGDADYREIAINALAAIGGDDD